MKSVFFFVVSLFSAQVLAGQPGLYNQMKDRFENALQSAQLSDFPSFSNRNALSCILVASNDEYTSFSGGYYRVTKVIPSSGPLVPERKEVKLFSLGPYSDMSEEKMISEFYHLISNEKKSDRLIIYVHQSPTIDYSPASVEFKKGDFLYYKANLESKGLTFYGYCYPTPR